MSNRNEPRTGRGPCPACDNMGMVCSPGSHDMMYMQACRCGCPVRNDPFLAMLATGIVLGAVAVAGLLTLVP
ncbi:hypothetical protein [Sphingomonas montana]|uniref:hypothetical protein n=1 Tax=Sphingomonas montana TaxID=1843236 RepID=UPI00096D012A|nr:hypothetical protein [Sphingomonas montana]